MSDLTGSYAPTAHFTPASLAKNHASNTVHSAVIRIRQRRFAVYYSSVVPTEPLADFIERLSHLRIYDPAYPERYRRFSGAVVSDTYHGPFVTDTEQHPSIAVRAS